MATWRAKCWLGSASGYQELEVQANTFQGAVEQFERIYGAEQIINARQVSDNGSEFSSTSFAQVMALCAIAFVIYYWYIVVPIAVIIGIIKLIFWIKRQ
jgi:hypothetical protein